MNGISSILVSLPPKIRLSMMPPQSKFCCFGEVVKLGLKGDCVVLIDDGILCVENRVVRVVAL